MSTTCNSEDDGHGDTLVPYDSDVVVMVKKLSVELSKIRNDEKSIHHYTRNDLQQIIQSHRDQIQWLTDRSNDSAIVEGFNIQLKNLTDQISFIYNGATN